MAHIPVDGARRSEILETAAGLIASSGLRTSLKEIADACGIQAGSLYHHFDSKEAILVELIEQYQVDLDRVAGEIRSRLDEGTASIDDQIVAMANEMADCAHRHRAALLLTFYEPPTWATDALVRVAQQTSNTIEQAALDVFSAGRQVGDLRAGIDFETFADRFCGAMLHIGLGVLRGMPGGDQVPEIRCRIFLDGIAPDAPGDAQLDTSAAMQAAQETIDSWDTAEQAEDEGFALLRSVARTEFGRKGYDATTVRDIASAAGMSIGSVYRLVGSKDELLATIMQSFVTRVRAAWNAVLETDATPLEKLDALIWTDINVVERYSDEFSIQVAWLRESPPTTSNLGASFAAHLRDVKRLLADGRKSGELALEGPNADLRAWSLFELLWMPDDIVDKTGKRRSLELARESVIRGIAANNH